MNTDGMIEITGANLTKAVKHAYNLSSPQGLGYLHFEEGELTDEEAESLVNKDNLGFPINMDYVKGRACKFRVFGDEGRLFIEPSWYDHTKDDLTELLARIEEDKE